MSTLKAAALGSARRAYAAGLRARYGRTGMPWRVHDDIVRIDPGVRHLVPHASEPALYAFLQRRVRPGEIVLDVGAFLGIYAILEARRAGPGGRVVALEPTPWSAAIARRHIAFNTAGAAGITLIEAAAGDTARRAVLHEYEQPYVNALTEAVDVDAAPSRRTVDVVSLDSICAQLALTPTFVRMDVQGAEIQALEGARELIRSAPPGFTIVAEMHPQCWPAFGVDAAIAQATIESLGLRAEPLDPGEPLFGRDAHAVLTLRERRG